MVSFKGKKKLWIYIEKHGNTTTNQVYGILIIKRKSMNIPLGSLLTLDLCNTFFISNTMFDEVTLHQSFLQTIRHLMFTAVVFTGLRGDFISVFVQLVLSRVMCQSFSFG